MKYIWYFIIILIIYSLYKRFVSPIYESFKKGTKMINDLSVDDRHTNIQDLLSKQAKVFEGLKDDPEAMIKEISNFKPFKKLKKKKKKKKNKKKKENKADIEKKKITLKEKMSKVSEKYNKHKKEIDKVLDSIPQMKELYKHIDF